ncbi:hypothetical protein ACHAWF_010997 [Thalassiosira exigua]
MLVNKLGTLVLYYLLSLLRCSLHCSVSGYTILGGLDDSPSSRDDADDDESIVAETLRHFAPPRRVLLRTQSHEPASGRVSMAGTLWEASPLLADYVTNPRRMTDHDDDEPPSRPSTVVELGSGVGLASLAAAFLGCRVVATDGSPSSVRLLEENFARHAADCPVAPIASLLEWGDDGAVDALVREALSGRPPDVVMASDVVYAHSAREELARTIRRLCPPGYVEGRVVIAHRWRADPADEESFFQFFDDEFHRKEVGPEFFPETDDGYYRRRSLIDMRYPVSIFEMRRK